MPPGWLSSFEDSPWAFGQRTSPERCHGCTPFPTQLFAPAHITRRNAQTGHQQARPPSRLRGHSGGTSSGEGKDARDPFRWRAPTCIRPTMSSSWRRVCEPCSSDKTLANVCSRAIPRRPANDRSWPISEVYRRSICGSRSVPAVEEGRGAKPGTFPTRRMFARRPPGHVRPCEKQKPSVRLVDPITSNHAQSPASTHRRHPPRSQRCSAGDAGCPDPGDP